MSGTYNRLEGKRAATDCLPCPAGYYCSEVGKDRLVSQDECPARYFCPEGSEDYADNECPRGGSRVLICLVISLFFNIY